MLNYVRASTGQIIIHCCPVLVTFLSILIYFHETFYWHYVTGAIICIFGSCLFILNENKAGTKKLVVNDNLFAGIIFSLANLLFDGISRFGGKIMIKVKFEMDILNYYIGKYNTLLALFLCAVEKHYGFNDIKYILYAISNGLCFFNLAKYLQDKILENLSINKFILFNNMSIGFNFIFGFVLLHESVYFTDIIGAGLIIGFHIYNLYYPRRLEPKLFEKIKQSKNN